MTIYRGFSHKKMVIFHMPKNTNTKEEDVSHLTSQGEIKATWWPNPTEIVSKNRTEVTSHES